MSGGKQIAPSHPARPTVSDTGPRDVIAPKRSQDMRLKAPTRGAYERYREVYDSLPGVAVARNQISDNKRLSAFDLDLLREAFQKSAREHGVTAADWAEHAKLFIERTAQSEPGKEFTGRSTPP
ncbi:hypothetical protein [Mesorhizobium sp. M4B.F.Ca.ET.017.02.2.1]|uniref:hypothetical protein n=1 Tax=Mesorhizobium sp. M4B.F.Ca.ET.017.02.2.1 TaxID=2496649 RepID=UPI000FCA94E6|nr:hypothetical protein [Mesorhizobium sp. M4B.F.Ca.ET.017.02.2.1]